MFRGFLDSDAAKYKATCETRSKIARDRHDKEKMQMMQMHANDAKRTYTIRYESIQYEATRYDTIRLKTTKAPKKEYIELVSIAIAKGVSPEIHRGTEMDKANIDIVEIISADVALEWNGRRWFGCCPFHAEKTPSFSVSPERQRFHCFGCGESGDVIDFVRKLNGWSYPAALKSIGIKSGPLDKKERDRREEARQKREAIAAFQIWKIHYGCQLAVEMEIQWEIGKALTPENFDEYCGLLGENTRIEHEWRILCWGTEQEQKELYLSKGMKADIPLAGIRPIKFENGRWLNDK